MLTHPDLYWSGWVCHVLVLVPDDGCHRVRTDFGQTSDGPSADSMSSKVGARALYATGSGFSCQLTLVGRLPSVARNSQMASTVSAVVIELLAGRSAGSPK